MNPPHNQDYKILNNNINIMVINKIKGSELISEITASPQSWLCGG